MLPCVSMEQEGPIRHVLEHKGRFPTEAIIFATAGSKGCVRVWCSSKKHSLLSLECLQGSDKPCSRREGQEGEMEGERGSNHDMETGPAGGYMALHFNENSNILAAVTYDHNIEFYDSLSFERKKQVSYFMLYSLYKLDRLEVFVLNKCIITVLSLVFIKLLF